jgi:hypothetical protein
MCLKLSHPFLHPPLVPADYLARLEALKMVVASSITCCPIFSPHFPGSPY